MTFRSDTWRAVVCMVLVYVLLALTLVLSAQAPASETAEIPLPAGTTYVAVRAVNAAGAQSGYSNVVRVVRSEAGPTRFWWDANTESDLAAYVLVWGAASGVYTESFTVVPGVPPPVRLPAPSLRIRAAE
jgi:hypothetical protein